MSTIPPAPCTDCGKLLARSKQSKLNPTCHPCRRERHAARQLEREEHEAGTGTRPCRDCGEAFYRWDTYSHGGTHRVCCHPCYLAYARERARLRPKLPRPQRSCRFCGRLFGPSRYWHCSEFCRATACCIPEDLRFLINRELVAELASSSPPCGPNPNRIIYVTVTQWRRRPGAHDGGDARYLAGPPPHPLDLRVNAMDEARCPDCWQTMAADEETWECYRCDLTAWKPASGTDG